MEKRIHELQQLFAGLPGKLVIISGPSAGAGKGKVIDELREMAGGKLWLSQSMTTRQVRADDKIHHKYQFVTLEEFERAEAAGELLEANGVTVGSRYGTPLQPILDRLAKGETVLLEIEINGAQFVHEVAPQALCIFIKPTDGSLDDDMAELRRRLIKRGSDNEDLMQQKLDQAVVELKRARELDFYDAWVVNAAGRSEEAARQIYELIQAHQVKV